VRLIDSDSKVYRGGDRMGYLYDSGIICCIPVLCYGVAAKEIVYIGVYGLVYT
jgi:hypothetical protein